MGSFAPNAYGLYDMAGNVWEWCWDRHGSAYYAVSLAANPLGPEAGSGRVVRGGSWHFTAFICRVADRDWDAPSLGDFMGFRLARGQ